MATARFAWGIDIGNRALKAIKLVREGEGVRIDDFDVIEHEHVLSTAGDNKETLVQNALAHFAQTHPMKGAGAVAVGVSGQQSFARFIKLPPVEPRKIPEIVRFEAIQQIPFPLDEVEWSYQLFHDEASPDVEVGIFAMRKDLVNQHIGYFTSAGIPVQAVQMNPLAVYNAMYYDQWLKGTTMIIDLGAENADLIITEGESIWLRSIPIGGNNFTEALTKAFKLRFEKAEELKRNAQTSKYGRQILQAMRPVFADLVAEIQRSIGFYSSVHRDSRITRVLAIGGTFKLPGLQKYLQQNLSLEVQKVDALGQAPPADAKVAATLNDNLLSSVGAYGLALQALGDAKITSSLLPQVIRRERMWKEKTKWFAAAAACFVVGTAIPYVRLTQSQASHAAAQDGFRKVEKVYQDGKLMSDSWQQVQDRGAEDRARIARVRSLTEYRDTWPEIVKTIESVLPAPPADLNLLKQTPRPQRQHIVLDDIQAEYRTDIAPLVAQDAASGQFVMPDNQFYTFAAKRDPNAQNMDLRNRRNVGVGVGGANDALAPAVPSVNPYGSAGTGYSYPGGAAAGTGYDMPSQAPADPTLTPGAPGTAATQRGFIVTLHMVTPNKQGDVLVQTAVVQALRQREQQWKQEEAQKAAAKAAEQAAAGGQPQGAPPGQAAKPADSTRRAFSIPRITIASNRQLINDPQRLEMLRGRARMIEERKKLTKPPFDPGDPSGGGFQQFTTTPDASYGTGYTYPSGTGYTYPGTGYSTGAAGPEGQPGQNVPVLDPLTGEDITADWEVVVVAAVVIDPPPPQAPAAPAAQPPQ